MEPLDDNTTRPKRMNFSQKLERLRISEDQFNFYWRTFIQDHTRYRIKEKASDWYVVKSRNGQNVKLTRDVVAYHLLGKHWISVFGPILPRYICIDLDPSPERDDIYWKITHRISSPLTFQSSDRKGLHVYIFLSADFPIRAEKLYNITERALKYMGIEAAPGICEIFPRPTRSLRLPLGDGSFLLDPRTLAPLCTDLKQTLDIMESNLRRYSFVELFPELWQKIHGKK